MDDPLEIHTYHAIKQFRPRKVFVPDQAAINHNLGLFLQFNRLFWILLGIWIDDKIESSLTVSM